VLLKTPPLRDRAYLDSLRDEPCIITGRRGEVDPAHIGTAGRGIKNRDDWALPISHAIHVEMHQHGEITVLRQMAPDYVLRMAFQALAERMYREAKR
jgi:uncharacterized membrane protein